MGFGIPYAGYNPHSGFCIPYTGKFLIRAPFLIWTSAFVVRVLGISYRGLGIRYTGFGIPCMS